MLNRMLPIAALVLTFVSWISTAILVRHARRRPRIGALGERALLAVLISVVGTLSVLVLMVANTEIAEPTRVALRLALLACSPCRPTGRTCTTQDASESANEHRTGRQCPPRRP